MNRFDELLGHDEMTQEPYAYGEQPGPVTIKRFNRDGVCVERRVVPSAIRIEYPKPDARPWWRV